MWGTKTKDDEPTESFGETEQLMKYTVDSRDIEKYQRIYQQQVESGEVTVDAKFQYAWCLVHSRPQLVKQAVPLLEELFREGSEQIKRDSLFYLAVAHTKLRNYVIAKKHITAFLSVEPSNVQAKQLKAYITSRLKKDGLTGMAIVGGAAVLGGAAAVAIGGLVLATGVGMAVAKVFKGKSKDSSENDKSKEEQN